MDSKLKNGQLTLVGPLFGEVQNCTPILLFWARGNCPKAGPSKVLTTYCYYYNNTQTQAHARTHDRTHKGTQKIENFEKRVQGPNTRCHCSQHG